MTASHERVRKGLRAACLAGDKARVAELLLLKPPWYKLWLCSTPPEPDPQVVLEILRTPFPEDGNTLLHYVCGGSPLVGVGRMLWASCSYAGEVQPGRHDALRAQLLAWLLARHPPLLALLCHRNRAGLTPLHCCLRCASLETLRALVAAVQASPATPAQRLLLLSVPAPGGAAPLDQALLAHQWEAVVLLVGAGAPALCHNQLLAAHRVGRLVGKQSQEGGGQGPRLAGAVRGAVAGVRGYLGQLVDLVAGQGREREAVLQHQQQAQRAQRAQCGQRAGGERRASRGRGGEAPAPAAGGGVEVLRGAEEVQRLRAEQIESTAYVLGVSSPEAAALLDAHGWDELAAVQSRLGGAGSNGGARGAVDAPPAWRPSVAGAAQRGEAEAQRSMAVRTSGGSGGVGLAAVLAPARPSAPASSDAASSGAGDFERGFPAAAAAAEAAGVWAAGSTDKPAGRRGEPPGPCLVCYEDCGGSGAWRALPCGHPTCDACWRGILLAQLDTGEVHRAVCPSLGCGMPLPVEAAGRLLPRQQLERFQQLMAQSYVDANPNLRWCTRPGCGNVVRLVGGAGTAGRAALPTLRDAAAAGRGVSVRCACGHSFCWACSGDAHEPATCEQERRWQQELAALRAASPSQDQQWIAQHTKHCPSCSAPTEKHGGCMHMTCRSCRHHWCWQCGRDWADHTSETGGFYHCILEPREDLPDFRQQPAALGALGWLRDVWGALQSMAAQRALEQQLRQFLRHDFNPAAATTLATHMQWLLLAAGACRCGLGSQPGKGRGQGQGGFPEAGARVQGQYPSCPSWEYQAELGPGRLLGLTLEEAAAMPREEWGQVVTAAAASLTASIGARRAAGTAGAAAAAGAAACACARQGACSACAALACLPQQLAAAHGALQHAAVAAWALGSFGPRRRFLAKLCESIEGRVAWLEGLLMGMPERDAALQCQQQFRGGSSAWAAGGRQVAVVVGRLLHSLYGVSPPQPQPSASPVGEQEASHHWEAPEPRPSSSAAAQHQQQQEGQQRGKGEEKQPPRQREQRRQWAQQCLSRGLTGAQLQQQVHYVLAVHGQGRHLCAELAGLEAAVAELMLAGRAGLFDG